MGGRDRTIENLKKGYPNNVGKLEEALNIYISEKDPKILKTDFPDEWKHLNKKLAYTSEYFVCLEDHQKTVNDLKQEDFSSNLKNRYPDDKKRDRTKKLLN